MAKMIFSIFFISLLSIAALANEKANPSSWRWTLSSPKNNSISSDMTPVLKAQKILNSEGTVVNVYTDSFCTAPVGSPSVILNNTTNVMDIKFNGDGSDDGIKSFWVIATDSEGNASSCEYINLGYFLNSF